jgi:hypothetical protein
MSKPITHIVRSKDAGGFNHFTRCGSIEEAETKRRELRNNHGHLSAIIITVEPVEIPTKRGPVIGYRPATEAKRPARQAVS